MKLKILILKKIYILYFLLISLLFILLFIFISSNTETSQLTLNYNSNKQIYKADLTGDGKKDTILISPHNNKYYIQINTEKNIHYLEPNKKLNTLGYFCPFWPIQIKLYDISRDIIPEIFIQSSQNNVSIQHIFIWEEGHFKDIFCSYNNILGILDHSTNKTPKIISGKLSKGTLNFSNYILLKNTLEEFNYNKSSTFIGKDTILSFINYINNLSDTSNEKPEEIFSENLKYENIDIIKALAEKNNTYIFQDAFFIDTACNEKGEYSEIKWQLNFRGISKENPESIDNYCLVLTLRPFKNNENTYYYKIISIKSSSKNN